MRQSLRQKFNNKDILQLAIVAGFYPTKDLEDYTCSYKIIYLKEIVDALNTLHLILAATAQIAICIIPTKNTQL